MNWYINQEIVCIKSHSQGIVKEGKIYTIKSLRGATCKCNDIEIDIGAKAMDRYNNGLFHVYCPTCKSSVDDNSSTHWLSERIFAPLEYDQNAIEELLSITTPCKHQTIQP